MTKILVKVFTKVKQTVPDRRRYGLVNVACVACIGGKRGKEGWCWGLRKCPKMEQLTLSKGTEIMGIHN
jgi:hypothetical protein